MLSDDFYQEILAHPVPNDLEAVKVLAASAAILDLYMWLSYQSFKAKGTESIPIFGEFGLANQLGCVEYSRRRRFRAMVEQWLDTIRRSGPIARRESCRMARRSRSETQRRSVNGIVRQQSSADERRLSSAARRALDGAFRSVCDRRGSNSSSAE